MVVSASQLHESSVDIISAKEAKDLYKSSESERSELLLYTLSSLIKSTSRSGQTQIAVDYNIYRSYSETLTDAGYWLSYSREADDPDPEFMIIDWSFGDDRK